MGFSEALEAAALRSAMYAPRMGLRGGRTSPSKAKPRQPLQANVKRIPHILAVYHTPILECGSLLPLSRLVQRPNPWTFKSSKYRRPLWIFPVLVTSLLAAPPVSSYISPSL